MYTTDFNHVTNSDHNHYYVIDLITTEDLVQSAVYIYRNINVKKRKKS